MPVVRNGGAGGGGSLLNGTVILFSGVRPSPLPALNSNQFLITGGAGPLAWAPTLPALSDDFDDNSRDTVKWAIGQLKSAFWTFAGYSILEQNQRLEVTPVATTPASAGGYVSQSTYDMTGKAIFAKVTPSGALPGAQEVYVSFGPDEADVYLALISGGGIYIQENNSGSITTTNVVATYNATTHAWLMLAHDGGSPGNIVLYTAPSSASNPPAPSDWVTQGSVPRVVTITAAKLALGCDTYASVATPVAVYFDGFNTATAAATTSYSLTAVAGAFTMTGNAGGLAYGYKLTASTGTFALTGNATGLRRGYPLVATTATFNLTGNATRLALARRLVAAVGSFALTGNAARLAEGYRLGAAAGAFTLTGFATGLRVGWRLTANTGTLAMSGQAANLSYGRRLAAAAGSFALTGNSARLAISRYLRTASGSFAFTGNAANLTATGSYRLAASSGAFVLTGNAAAFRYAYRLQALTGAFSLAGMDALLTYHANVLAFVRATPPGLAAITGAGTPAAAALVPRAAPASAAIAAAASPGVGSGFVRATPPPLAELN